MESSEYGVTANILNVLTTTYCVICCGCTPSHKTWDSYFHYIGEVRIVIMHSLRIILCIETFNNQTF